MDFSTKLKYIEEYSFYNCDALENIHIPSSVKKVGKYAFAECDNLADVVVLDTLILDATTFDNSDDVYENFYQRGMKYLNDNHYENAYLQFIYISGYKDTKEKIKQTLNEFIEDYVKKNDHIGYTSRWNKMGKPSFDHFTSEEAAQYLNIVKKNNQAILNGYNCTLEEYYMRIEPIKNMIEPIKNKMSECQKIIEFYEMLFENRHMVIDDFLKVNNKEISKMWDIDIVRNFCTNDYYIIYFMMGRWSARDTLYYIDVLGGERNRVRYFLPTPDINEDVSFYRIKNQIYSVYNDAKKKIADYWKFEFVGYNEVVVYCYSNGQIYTLYR